MDYEFSILIADRNNNVREFLRREFMAERFQVQTAKDGREVMKLVSEDDTPDLLILDLEMPYVDGLTILTRIQERVPPLPVVVYTYLVEQANHPAVQYAAAFVEKGGDLERLKRAVNEALRKNYPHLFAST